MLVRAGMSFRRDSTVPALIIRKFDGLSKMLFLFIGLS
jgi:hypothetical protein